MCSPKLERAADGRPRILQDGLQRAEAGEESGPSLTAVQSDREAVGGESAERSSIGAEYRSLTSL